MEDLWLNPWLPVMALATSLVASVVIFALPEHRHGVRAGVNLAAALLKLVLVMVMVLGVFRGIEYRMAFTMMPGIEFELKADSLSMMFAGLSAVLWLLTTAYAVGYLENSPNRSRFFGFFSLCVASTMGISLAGNLFTFFLFYEMLTLSTYPLVVHRGTTQALQAGRTYIIYTLCGGALLLLGMAWLYAETGTLDFEPGGSLEGPLTPALAIIFALLIAGLGVKAALFPLHGWLPEAMVAPAPVSALLHAVAVVKAGAFGIVRVVSDVFGVEFADRGGLLQPLAWLAAFTIIYGSLQALRQQDLKRRLAFSTISQVSYIMLGLCLAGPLGMAGGLAHLLHQGIMKITLFFCAGNYAETLGVHRIDELDGAGRRMPVTSVAFTIGAFGMIGSPPLAGFITKWTMGLGALEADMPWVLAVLLISSVLNAVYFLPIVHRLWFRPQRRDWPAEVRWGRLETLGWLLWPPVITGGATVVVGVLAAAAFSPLSWAELVVNREYLP
ncbi:MAG: complex I subunit 5 family protein [Marinobacter sp.]